MLSKKDYRFGLRGRDARLGECQTRNGAGASRWTRTEFTFNAPVELPGVTLPPGTYVFRFVDATTSRKVMQVQAKNDPTRLTVCS